MIPEPAEVRKYNIIDLTPSVTPIVPTAEHADNAEKDVT
jgi:hypothetical protein